MKKQRLNRYNVLRDRCRSLVCQSAKQHHRKAEAKEDHQLSPDWHSNVKTLHTEQVLAFQYIIDGDCLVYRNMPREI